MHKIGIIGLGYVGLPLAHAFSEKFEVMAFDINDNRIDELKSNLDRTGELSEKQLQEFFDNGGKVYSDVSSLSECNVYIITVPTPIDDSKQPDLSPLREASNTVGNVLSADDIVIYESTVYPGVTEEICVPILEKTSGLQFNKDFFCGYSPERINPGDKSHTVKKIKKITSGSTEKIAKIVDSLYAQIIDAGTYLASSIKVAEAAKVIENTQRNNILSGKNPIVFSSTDYQNIINEISCYHPKDTKEAFSRCITYVENKTNVYLIGDSHSTNHYLSLENIFRENVANLSKYKAESFKDVLKILETL